ncbi:hypothetical protein K1719_041698 [Acacia pycnantha]|nr:hypothetical protein K1719_041698 [Acacia pycnantha]
MWTADKDKLLVECLVQLRTKQRFMVDNGFKLGYANQLEAMMLERQPDSEIKGNPHILSCIKTMKVAWQVVYDMVYGTNTSGFGWDPNRQCVVADKEVWDEYIKVHKKARTYKNKCLPHFQDMCFVWSKDRAVDDYCKSPKGMVEEIHKEQEVIPESPIHLDNIATPESHIPPVGTLLEQGTTVTRVRLDFELSSVGFLDVTRVARQCYSSNHSLLHFLTTFLRRYLQVTDILLG